jgi:hypothetical protein
LGANSGLSIGTISAAPSSGLKVGGAVTFDSSLSGTSANFSSNLSIKSSGNNGLIINSNYTPSGKYWSLGVNYNNNDGELVFIPTSTSFSDAKIIFQQNGRVGIGTLTDAGYLLDVNGTGRFSSNFYVSGGTNTNVGNGIHAYYESNYAQLQLNGATTGGSLIDFSTSGTDYKGRIVFRNATNQFEFVTDSSTGNPCLVLASTGAATFSSSVSIGGANQGYNLDVRRTSTGDAAFDTVANFYKASTHNTGLLLRLKNTIVDLAANNITGGGGPTAGMSFSVSSGGTISTALTLASTGAATFSSNVIANSYIRTLDRFYAGDGTQADPSIRFWNSATGLYAPSSETLGFVTNTTEKMRITSGGNVGIGTSSPSGGISGTEVALELSNSNVAVLALTSLAASGKKYQIYSSNDGGLYFRDNTAASQRIVITSAGNVGIGMSSPAVKLDVQNSSIDGIANVSSFSVTGNGGAGRGVGILLGAAGSSNSVQVARLVGYQELATSTAVAASFAIQVANSSAVLTERLRISSAGNVIIGTTGDAGFKLNVNGTGNFSGALSGTSATFSSTLTASKGTFNGTTSEPIRIERVVSGTTVGRYSLAISSGGNFSLYDATADADRLTIASTGAATLSNLAGTGSRAVLADANGLLSAPVSDISVKQNITTIGYGLNEILKMNPVWFDFIDEYKNYGEGRQNGNIAQEMQEIIPEAVFTTPSTGKMGINYDQMHAVYIKAIQELEARIKQLENK